MGVRTKLRGFVASPFLGKAISLLNIALNTGQNFSRRAAGIFSQAPQTEHLIDIVQSQIDHLLPQTQNCIAFRAIAQRSIDIQIVRLPCHSKAHRFRSWEPYALKAVISRLTFFEINIRLTNDPPPGEFARSPHPKIQNIIQVTHPCRQSSSLPIRKKRPSAARLQRALTGTNPNRRPPLRR